MIVHSSATILKPTMIHIDGNLVRPHYPKEMSVLYPDLEYPGIAEYDVRDVNPWLHKMQTRKVGCTGDIIFNFLKEEKLLESCLNLQDGHAFQQQIGVGIFYEKFGYDFLYLWRAIGTMYGSLYVPYLCLGRREIKKGWRLISSIFDSTDKALRFMKK
jgi:hypothetical protein